MNTYLVPTTAPYTYDTCMPYNPFNRNDYDHILMVCATTAKEAYEKAQERLISLCYAKELSEYEYYSTELNIPSNEDSYPFPISEKYDILYESFKHTKGFEYMGHFPIDVQFDHILDDTINKERLPKGFLEKENKICILTGAIELMKKKVSANYKLAIPQCYEDKKIQLLLPLCLDTDDGKPNLALAVTKLETCYQGHTCLTLDMAYNNARLIAKPESNWLSQ